MQELEKEMFAHQDEALNEIDSASQRLWTSAKKMRCNATADQREFCSILNTVIRLDNQDALAGAVVLVRSINQLCVTRRINENQQVLPPDDRCFRGGGLPDQHRAFFQPGKKYRVPGFLATSFKEDKAEEFLYRAHDESKLPAVKWVIELDPRGKSSFKYRCKHVNFVSKTNVPGEEEYLFAPYSVFTVKSAHWSDTPDDETPHIITLTAAIDNRKESEELPLAPWS